MKKEDTKGLRKVAIFDIDGTIFRSSLLIELVEVLIEKEIFPVSVRADYNREKVRWLDREGDYESYIMAVVAPDERSAASGVTNIARSVGAALAPSLTGAFLSAGLINLSFFMAGGLKLIYDTLLYRSFRSIEPPEEIRSSTRGGESR